MTKKLIFHKGITKKSSGGKGGDDVYDKEYVGLEYEVADEADEATVAGILVRMRSLVEQELGSLGVSKVPDFNPELLLKHPWKGKKTGEGEYAKGSCSWGWDFIDKFSKEVIAVLKKGPLTIDKYEFALNDTKTLVQAKKKPGTK